MNDTPPLGPPPPKNRYFLVWQAPDGKVSEEVYHTRFALMRRWEQLQNEQIIGIYRGYKTKFVNTTMTITKLTVQPEEE